MKKILAHIPAFCVLLTAFSLLSPGRADFSFNFETGKTASTFFFLLSNTTSQPTFAAPFGTSGGFLNLTREKIQTSHAMWYRDMQFVDDGFNFTFEFRIPDRSANSGDGLAFVIQPATMGPFNPFLTDPPDWCPAGASPAGCQPNPPIELQRQNNEVSAPMLRARAHDFVILHLDSRSLSEHQELELAMLALQSRFPLSLTCGKIWTTR
jgi:hypothetical protein